MPIEGLGGDTVLTSDNRPHDALGFLIDALLLLDEADAPPHIGAHLDFAIHGLRASLGSEDETASN